MEPNFAENICFEHGLELTGYCEAKDCGKILCLGCYKSHKCTNLKSKAFLMIDESLLINYKFKSYLGAGSFGAVFNVESLLDGGTYALKVITKVEKQEFNLLRKEILIMNKLKHPNIVQYFGSNYNPHCEILSIWMELCDKSLDKVLRSLDQKDAFNYFSQICEGVNFLHKVCNPAIIHRDLKPGNILISEKEIKLCDFGEAREIKANGITLSNSKGFGTPEYLAPEIYNLNPGEKLRYTEKTDIWALGIIFYKMLSKNKHPFFDGIGRDDYGDALRKKDLIISLSIKDEVARNVITQCLQKDPQNRADIEEIISLLKNRIKSINFKQETSEGKFKVNKILKGHSDRVNLVIFSPDEKCVLTGSGISTTDKKLSPDFSIKIWNCSSGKLMKTIQLNSAVHGLCFSSTESNHIFCGSYHDGICEFNLDSGEKLRNFQDHPASLWCLHISPNGQILASGSSKNEIVLWSTLSAEKIDLLKGHSRGVSSICFSPSGKEIASGSFDTTVKLWNVSSKLQLRNFEGHTQYVWSVKYSSDGARLLSGSDDKTVKIWDISLGACLKTLIGHSNGVAYACFSQKNELVFSGSDDKKIIIWDWLTGKVLETLEKHLETVWCLSVTKDGSRIASVSGDTNIIIWDRH